MLESPEIPWTEKLASMYPWELVFCTKLGLAIRSCHPCQVQSSLTDFFLEPKKRNPGNTWLFLPFTRDVLSMWYIFWDTTLMQNRVSKTAFAAMEKGQNPMIFHMGDIHCHQVMAQDILKAIDVWFPQVVVGENCPGLAGCMLVSCGWRWIQLWDYLYIFFWRFPKMGGTPTAGWFIMERSIQWMIWGYPYCRKPPFVCVCVSFVLLVTSVASSFCLLLRSERVLMISALSWSDPSWSCTPMLSRLSLTVQ